MNARIEQKTTSQTKTPQSVETITYTDPQETFAFESRRRGLWQALHIILIQILNRLPRWLANALFVLASKGQETSTVSQYASGYKSLEVIYTFPEKRRIGKSTISGFIWWSTLDNARAVYNRLLIVQQELIRSIHGRTNGQVRLLSIGSGSARAVLHTLQWFHDHTVRAMLLDRDEEAVKFSKDLALQLGLTPARTQIEWVRAEFTEVGHTCREFRPDIIEMVGMLDYLPDPLAQRLLATVRRTLQPGGMFITGNIVPNKERPFVEKGVKWPPMIYRTEEKLREILIKAGFAPEHIQIQTEPIGIHMVATVHIPERDMVS